ncbi:MAG: cytochrome c oxidase assembly protein [Solirubrobacterales bacterium]|nr:cytochrome c oxidase assembly protein [Solirubrobacterales bacterium]
MNLLPHLPFAVSPTLVAIMELTPLTLAVVYYWHRAMTLSWEGRPIPVWRQVCFGSGIGIFALALFSPVGSLAEDLVIFHMVEHLMIGDVATLLVVLGLTRSLLQPILAIPLFNRLQVLTNPILAFLLWGINLFIWHIPALYDAAYGGALVHGLQHGMFFFFGALMWMPVFGPLPVPRWFGPGWKIIYVVVVRFMAGLLGNVLMWSGTEIYTRYGSGQRSWGLSAIEDQGIAGVVMMMEGLFFIIGIIAWTYYRSAGQSMRKQELVDLAYLGGIEIEEERIERAVRSGHDDLLEARIRKEAAAAGIDLPVISVSADEVPAPAARMDPVSPGRITAPGASVTGENSSPESADGRDEGADGDPASD